MEAKPSAIENVRKLCRDRLLTLIVRGGEAEAEEGLPSGETMDEADEERAATEETVVFKNELSHTPSKAVSSLLSRMEDHSEDATDDLWLTLESIQANELALGLMVLSTLKTFKVRCV